MKKKMMLAPTIMSVIITILIITQIDVSIQASSFPLHQFLNVSEVELSKDIIHDMLCPDKKDPFKCCECGENCMHDGTCCINQLWRDNVDMDVHSYVSLFLKESRRYKPLLCVNAFPYVNKMGHRAYRYLMVASCQDGASKHDVSACLNDDYSSFQSALPVIGVDKYLYKNKYCASCNSVRGFRPVNVLAFCEERLHVVNTTASFSLSGMKSCQFSIYLHGKVKVRRCTQNLVWNKKCTRGNAFYSLCRAYTGAYSGYANYYCWRCNNEKTHSLTQQKAPCAFEYHDHLLLSPWTVHLELFDLSEKSYVSIEHFAYIKESTACSSGRLPDILLNKCVPYTCPRNYRLVNSSCQKIVQSIDFNKMEFTRCLHVTNPFLFLLYTAGNSSHTIAMIASLLNISSHSFVHYATQNQTTVTEIRVQFVDVLMNQLESTPTLAPKLFGIINRLVLSSVEPIVTQVYQIDFSRSFPGKRLCAEPTVLDTNNLNFSSSCGVYHNGRLLDAAHISMFISIDKNYNSRYISVCKKYFMHSDCLLQNLTDKVTMNANNSLIYREESGKNKIFQVQDYVPLQSGFGVCRTSVKLSWVAAVREAEGYISLVGACLSFVFYITMLVIFTKVKETLPGYGLAWLCVWLFFSDTLFLIAIILNVGNVNVPSHLCATIAFLLHWTMLSVQACAFVTAVDVFIRFRQTRPVYIETVKFFHYRIFAMCIPLVLATCGILLDKTGLLDIRYGVDGLCLLSGFAGRLFFFIIPTIISSICAITLLSISICTIARRNRSSGASLALHIILLYGIGEMIGFIQLTHSDLTETEKIINSVFAFLHTILRSFRGCMVGVLLCCKNGNFVILKRYLCNQRQELHVAATYAVHSGHEGADDAAIPTRSEILVNTDETVSSGYPHNIPSACSPVLLQDLNSTRATTESSWKSETIILDNAYPAKEVEIKETKLRPQALLVDKHLEIKGFHWATKKSSSVMGSALKGEESIDKPQTISFKKADQADQSGKLPLESAEGYQRQKVSSESADITHHGELPSESADITHHGELPSENKDAVQHGEDSLERKDIIQQDKNKNKCIFSPKLRKTKQWVVL